MRINYIVCILIQFLISSCVSCFQPLTVEDKFEEPTVDIVKEKPSKPMQSSFGKGKRVKRKIIMDQMAMLNLKNWYTCNKENVTVGTGTSGINIAFSNAVNDCFGIIFPSTDTRGYPILKMNAGVKEYSNTDMFDITFMLIDQNNNRSSVVGNSYLTHDGNIKSYFFDLRDLLLKNQHVNPSKIKQILFFINTVDPDPISGSFIISHIEFVKNKD